MLRHVRHAEINRPQWDKLIHEAPNGLIYALTWYLDTVSPGWEALVQEAEGRYVAVLPLPVRLKFGLRYLQQPLLTQQLGLFYLEAAAPTAASWQHIGELLRQRFRFITRYSFNTANAALLAAPLGSPLGSVFECEPFQTYHLSLRLPYATLLAGYSTKRRSTLSQARRLHLVVEPSTDIELLIELFRQHTVAKVAGGVSEEAYHILRRLYAAASQAGLAELWQARLPSGQVGALILLFRFKNQLTYIFSAADAEAKRTGAVTVLLNEVFRAYAGQEVCFDFEAPQVESVADFYRRFGSEAAPFLSISLNRLPWPVRQLRAARMALVRRLHPRPARDTGRG
jgi:hypothetical protein